VKFAGITLCVASQSAFIFVGVKCDPRFTKGTFEETMYLRGVFFQTRENCIGKTGDKTWVYCYAPEREE
jgi:hypothetical protein